MNLITSNFKYNRELSLSKCNSMYNKCLCFKYNGKLSLCKCNTMYKKYLCCKTNFKIWVLSLCNLVNDGQGWFRRGFR